MEWLRKADCQPNRWFHPEPSRLFHGEQILHGQIGTLLRKSGLSSQHHSGEYCQEPHQLHDEKLEGRKRERAGVQEPLRHHRTQFHELVSTKAPQRRPDHSDRLLHPRPCSRCSPCQLPLRTRQRTSHLHDRARAGLQDIFWPQIERRGSFLLGEVLPMEVCLSVLDGQRFGQDDVSKAQRSPSRLRKDVVKDKKRGYHRESYAVCCQLRHVASIWVRTSLYRFIGLPEEEPVSRVVLSRRSFPDKNSPLTEDNVVHCK